MKKEKWRELFSPENKKARNHVLFALLLGILLLGVGKSFSFSEKHTVVPVKDTEENLSAVDRETENRMAEILSSLEGAGQVDVMLTYRQTKEMTIAHNESREENGENRRVEQTAILLENADGATAPLVLTEASPVVEGVVIAAQGAGNPSVAAALSQAAQALLDVPAHKVVVLKMK